MKLGGNPIEAFARGLSRTQRTALLAYQAARRDQALLVAARAKFGEVLSQLESELDSLRTQLRLEIGQVLGMACTYVRGLQGRTS